MKISKLFHWLYASVMMLPLFASIVFAIYTRNENSIYTQSVDYEINKVVNFNQLLNNDYTQTHSYSDGSLTYVGSDYTFEVVSTSSNINQYILIDANVVSANTLNIGDTYLVKIVNAGNLNFRSDYAVNNASWSNGSYIIPSAQSRYFNVRVLTNGVANITGYITLYNLTQMFGVGNEPTVQEFEAWYPNDYYAYNTGTQQLLKNYSTETYNNADVGSQLIYTLYNSTNNYFNVTNFIGLNNLYDWISFNVFNGTPALAFSLFYMLLSYWLLVSIFWLVFDVVMYVPNLAHKWLDKASIE